MNLTATNFAEELQDHIADNSGLGYVVGRNFTLGELLDVDNLGAWFDPEILLTIFEEGGTLIRTGRKHRQERTFRFLCKGTKAQLSVNRAWAVLTWLENTRTFLSSTYRAWLARTDKMPSVVAADDSGTYLADFVVTFYVFSRTN